MAPRAVLATATFIGFYPGHCVGGGRPPVIYHTSRTF